MSEKGAELEYVEESEDRDNIRLVMEKLDSLRELRDHQHSLQQASGQLECCYHEYNECGALVTQCTAELSKLEGERSRLQERLKQIDHDMSQLTEVKQKLEEVRMQCVDMAPTDTYGKMEEQVNEERRTLGMEQLPLCEAYTQLSSCKQMNAQSFKKTHPGISVGRVNSSCKQAVKAGPSYKQCPSCGQLVSRNAIICSKCHSPCSRPGHSTGKKLK